MAATKRVIALSVQPNGSSIIITAAFWYNITSGITPKPTASSQWIASPNSPGASTADNTAIQNGTVIEEVELFPFPLGVQPTTIKDVLVSRWTVRNGELNGQGPDIYYGIFNDSVTGWSA